MKIGAFAELTGISAYTLRYYEKRACCLLNVIKMAVAIIWPKIGNGYSFCVN